MITLSPETALALFAFALAVGYAVIRWRDSKNAILLAQAKQMTTNAETDKLESDTSSKAIEAVTEGFRRKDVEASALHQRNTVLERENASLIADRDYWKQLAEARWKLIEEKNGVIAGNLKQLADCAAVNERANSEIARVTHDLDVVSKLYAKEIQNTIDRNLLNGESDEQLASD